VVLYWVSQRSFSTQNTQTETQTYRQTDRRTDKTLADKVLVMGGAVLGPTAIILHVEHTDRDTDIQTDRQTD